MRRRKDGIRSSDDPCRNRCGHSSACDVSDDGGIALSASRKTSGKAVPKGGRECASDKQDNEEGKEVTRWTMRKNPICDESDAGALESRVDRTEGRIPAYLM